MAFYFLFLGPENSQGSLIFGGFDTNKYLSKLQRYPIDTARGPDFDVNIVSISIYEESFSSNQSYVLDSGTSLGLVQKNDKDYSDGIFYPTIIQQGDITYHQVSRDQ